MKREKKYLNFVIFRAKNSKKTHILKKNTQKAHFFCKMF